MDVLSNLSFLFHQYSLPTILNVIWTQTGTMIMSSACGSARLSSLIASIQADERGAAPFGCKN